MINPSLIFAMMGSNASDEQQDSPDMEKAVANVEKAVAGAVVVSMDQEVHPEEQGEDDTNPLDGEPENKRVSGFHWVWITFQLVYGIYMIVIAFAFDCSIDTLNTWSAIWGLATICANVVAPIRKRHQHDESTAGSHIFVCFIMLYIWGGSAVFANIDPDDHVCNSNLYYPAFWSIVCGMGITFLLMLAGFAMTKCGRVIPRKCRMTS